jgi:hypothetical protein
LFTQGHQAVALEGHDELASQLLLDQLHIVSRGKPRMEVSGLRAQSLPVRTQPALILGGPSC